MIRQSVVLKFDPKTASQEIQEVFSNDLARVIWLAVRQGHLIEKSFHANCLHYAKIIKDIKQKEILTASRLLSILTGGYGPGIIGTSELQFAEELLPFVNGEKDIRFKIMA